MSKHDPRLKILAERIEEMVLSSKTLAELLLKNEGREGATGKPILEPEQVNSVMVAIIHLSRATHDDFCQLVDLAGVPQ